MNPILFLDIDDVICLSCPFGGLDAIKAVRGLHAEPDQVWRQLFSEGAVANLHRLHQSMNGKLSYVISSTWREYVRRHEMCTIFRNAGLAFVADCLEPGVQWRTPAPWEEPSRADEIAAWLDMEHRSQPFAIVDDTFSGGTLRRALTDVSHPFFNRVVLCDQDVGLRECHLKPLVDALGRPASSFCGVIDVE